MARVKRKNKTIPAKYILLVLTLVCFLLMLGSFTLGWTSGPVGTAASYVFIPMQRGLTTVGNWISDKTYELASLKDVMKENEQLKTQVDELTEELMGMGKSSTGSNVGTGGMNTKLVAAKIATSSDVDMIIANSRDLGVLHRILEGKNEGTLFVAHRDEGFDLPGFVDNLHKN